MTRREEWDILNKLLSRREGSLPPLKSISKKVINKHINGSKKEISQLTIKIDSRLDNALAILSQSLNISKNKLIEDILFESGILQEVDENYMEQE